MKSIYLLNDLYEILKYENGNCYIKDLSNNKYYYKKKWALCDEHNFTIVKQTHWNWKDSFYSILIFFSLISFIYIFFIQYDIIYNSNIKFTKTLYINCFIYITISVIVHESAHFLAMIFYNRKPGKIRLKRYYIFFNIITTTTDSYLLPKYRRFFIYYAGIMMNLIMYAITLFFFPSFAYLLRAVIWGVLYNLIPFGGLKTDGYHIFVNAILNINDLKKQKNILAEILKYVFVIFSIVTLADSILRILKYDGLMDFIVYLINRI